MLLIKNRYFYTLFIILGAGISLCNAQAITARLHGKVLDQNRAAVPGATVVAVAKGTTTKVSVVTDQGGEFSLMLAPGQYTLKISAKGFSQTSQTINLKQNAADSVEIVLQIAGSYLVMAGLVWMMELTKGPDDKLITSDEEYEDLA